jgi:hypothetical protein
MKKLIKKIRLWFARIYSRFCWGYEFIAKGLAIFNFVGIAAILLGPMVRSYIFVPIVMGGGFVGCVLLGWFMYDKVRLKTIFTEQEGNRNDYWLGKLTPNQIRVYGMLLECIEDPKKVKYFRKAIKRGNLNAIK